MESFFILRNISDPKKIMAENNGFNKFAFFLGPVWGIFRGLWFEGLIWFWLMNFAIFIAPHFFTTYYSKIRGRAIQKLYKYH